MKRLVITLILAAGLCGAVVWLPEACGQDGASPERRRPASASRIAYVDLGEVFRQYKKNEVLSQEVRQAASAGNSRIQEMVGKGREMEKPLRDGTLDKESPEFAELEKKVFQAAGNVTTFKAVKERQLKQQEIKALLEVYRDVSEAVRQFAEQNGYTLVLKIDREFEAARTYKTIQQTMSQVVVRHSARDDITDGVINFLNKQYEAAGASASSPAASQSRAPRDRSTSDEEASDAGSSAAGSNARIPPNPPSRKSSAR